MTVQAGRFRGYTGLPGVPVNVYAVGTTTPASIYTDKVNGTPAANPVLTDDGGSYAFFAGAGDLDVVFQSGDLTIRQAVTVWLDPSYSTSWDS
jgi:hypothetical protein